MEIIWLAQSFRIFFPKAGIYEDTKNHEPWRRKIQNPNQRILTSFGPGNLQFETSPVNMKQFIIWSKKKHKNVHEWILQNKVSKFTGENVAKFELFEI